MLDSNKDVLKLEAMKVLIGVSEWRHVLYFILNNEHRIKQMIAKGTDCSDYFPAVVKNVVAKNSEVNNTVDFIVICVTCQ